MAKTNYRDKIALVIDNGLFVDVALKLVESFGRVKYWTPWVNAFPKSNATLPGDGLDGIERILDWEDHVDDADIIVFPDVMFGATQELLVKQGKRVWGSRRAESLELDRWGTKKYLKKLNMPVAETHLIRGMDALRRFLQKNEGYWIKTSRYRGDFETFQSENYDLVKPVLDLRESEMGRKADIYPFIVEKNIVAITELGYDGFTVDGQFPTRAAFGKEEKDLGYAGVFKEYDQFPEQVKWVNEKLAPFFREKKYRGFWSSEVRCAEETVGESPQQFENFPLIWNAGDKVPDTDTWAFCTDPCCRKASPPGELYIEWFSNWADIIWHGSEGVMVEPEKVATYGVEIMLHSSWADTHWQPVWFPDEIKQFVKLRNWCRINAVHYAVPQAVGLPEIGAVIGMADDLAEAARLALDHASKVKGYFIEAKTEAIQKVITDINNMQEQGIPFSDEPLPDAETLESLQPTE